MSTLKLKGDLPARPRRAETKKRGKLKTQATIIGRLLPTVTIPTTPGTRIRTMGTRTTILRLIPTPFVAS